MQDLLQSFGGVVPPNTGPDCNQANGKRCA